MFPPTALVLLSLLLLILAACKTTHKGRLCRSFNGLLKMSSACEFVTVLGTLHDII